MPKKTEKQELKELVVVVGALGYCSPTLKIFESLDTLSLLALLDICRYSCSRSLVPKSSDWVRTVLSSEDYDEGRFRGQMRMEKSMFCDLVDTLKGTYILTTTCQSRRSMFGFRFMYYL